MSGLSLDIPIERVERIKRSGLLVGDKKGGMIQARDKQAGHRRPHKRAWRCTSRLATKQTVLTLFQLWDDTNEGACSFVWRPPESAIGLPVIFAETESEPLEVVLKNGRREFTIYLEEF